MHTLSKSFKFIGGLMLNHHLNIICDDVWNRLDASKKLGINQGEETLTDNLLLYLASQKLSNIKIIQTPKNEEKHKGTDWEWWIGNRKQGYLRYAVQAKKLNLKSGIYASLNHTVGKGSNARPQYEILEAYAKANKAIPIYAFYNHLESSEFPKSWNCPLPLDIPKFGCTVTPLKNVKTAISKRGFRSFEKIHAFPETVPLRCLGVCPNIAFSNKKVNKMGNVPKMYGDPWGWISEMGHLTSYDQMPSQFYDHELGLYPKRILLIETSEC
jgi:hypothetical protein